MLAGTRPPKAPARRPSPCYGKLGRAAHRAAETSVELATEDNVKVMQEAVGHFFVRLYFVSTAFASCPSGKILYAVIVR